MGLISKIAKRVEVPNEPGAWIEIRMLSWLTLDKSKKERLKEIIGMRDVVALFRESNGAALEAAKTAAASDPFQQHDQLTLLKHGVCAWSYGETVDVEALDETTAEWAARQ